jgi:hypothetical protein
MRPVKKTIETVNAHAQDEWISEKYTQLVVVPISTFADEISCEVSKIDWIL